jgi:hypothetical protein
MNPAQCYGFGVMLLRMQKTGIRILSSVGIVAIITCELLAQVATKKVRVLVIGPQGAGTIAHARLQVLPSSGPNSRLETDEKGLAYFDLQPRKYALQVSCEGFKSTEIMFEVDAKKDVQSFAVELARSPKYEKDTLLILAPPYRDQWQLTTAELKDLPRSNVMLHNSHSDAEESYSGVRLSDLLAKIGAPLGDDLRGRSLADYLVATGSDGYTVLLSLAEIDPSFHPGEVIVADTMDGKPLDAHSGPLKLVVTEDKRPARSVRNLVSIELRSAQ